MNLLCFKRTCGAIKRESFFPQSTLDTDLLQQQLEIDKNKIQSCVYTYVFICAICFLALAVVVCDMNYLWFYEHLNFKCCFYNVQADVIEYVITHFATTKQKHTSRKPTVWCGMQCDKNAVRMPMKIVPKKARAEPLYVSEQNKKVRFWVWVNDSITHSHKDTCFVSEWIIHFEQIDWMNEHYWRF